MKPGSKEKDRVIRDGFNRKKMTEAEAKKLKRLAAQEVVRKEARQKELDVKIAKLTTQIQSLKDKLSSLRAEAGYDDEDVDQPQGITASVMLEQMWKVYRQAGGLKKLKEVMTNAKEFRLMAKDMLKVEAAIAKAKKDEVNPGQVVYVILKGLQTEQDVYAGNLNLKQIRESLDPAGSPPVEIEKAGSSSPTQLQRPVEMGA